MTDNCAPERNALKSVWPAARQYLCAFHVLQQVWRWLLESKHGVKREERQELLAVVKRLLYAPTPKEFIDVWEVYSTSSMAENNASFTRYQYPVLCAYYMRSEMIDYAEVLNQISNEASEHVVRILLPLLVAVVWDYIKSLTSDFRFFMQCLFSLRREWK